MGPRIASACRCWKAAGGGHLPALQWLVARRAKCGPEATIAAAGGGHAAVLRWLSERGLVPGRDDSMPDDDSPFFAAVNRRSPHVAYDRHYRKSAAIAAAVGGHAATVLSLLHELGFPLGPGVRSRLSYFKNRAPSLTTSDLRFSVASQLPGKQKRLNLMDALRPAQGRRGAVMLGRCAGSERRGAHGTRARARRRRGTVTSRCCSGRGRTAATGARTRAWQPWWGRAAAV